MGSSWFRGYTALKYFLSLAAYPRIRLDPANVLFEVDIIDKICFSSPWYVIFLYGLGRNIVLELGDLIKGVNGGL